MKYFLIAGEPSGDQHAGRLMKALASKDSGAEFQFLGGDHMSEWGVKPVVHIKNMAFMGFTQVLFKLGAILKNFRLARKAIVKFNPDVVIFVDYPGFNMRMAKWSKARGYRTHYYISPTVWAWNTKRVYKLEKSCDRIFTILPFEKEFFKKYGVDVDYVGNPVYEEIALIREDLPEPSPSSSRQIAMLPGSRRQEIIRILPVMVSVAEHFDKYDFVVAAMDSHKDLYNKLTGGKSNISIEFGKTMEVLSKSAAALVTSGTATLETALLGIPQVVCYKAGNVSYNIAKRLIKVPYISLVNLILDSPAVPELIQSNLRKEFLVDCLKGILPGGANHKDQLAISELLKDKLGDKNVSERLSGLIISDLKSLG